MKPITSERQILMDLMSMEYVLKDGHMVPTGNKRENIVSKEKQKTYEKKSITSKIKKILQKGKLDEKKSLKIEGTYTKKYLDDIVNIKLDINSMIHVEPQEATRTPKEVKKYYMLRNSALKLLDIKGFSNYDIKTFLEKLFILDDFLTQKEKVNIDEEKDDDLKKLKNKLILLLENKVLKSLDYLNSRLDCFIELQTKSGTIFDDQYLKASLSDLLMYYGYFETACNRYFKIKDENLQIDYDSITGLFGEVKDKIEVVLRHNNVYTKCIFPPKM